MNEELYEVSSQIRNSLLGIENSTSNLSNLNEKMKKIENHLYWINLWCFIIAICVMVIGEHILKF